jgi:hypothetical protein
VEASSDDDQDLDLYQPEVEDDTEELAATAKYREIRQLRQRLEDRRAADQQLRIERRVAAREKEAARLQQRMKLQQQTQ